MRDSPTRPESVLAQRLVRVVCAHCARPRAEAQSLGAGDDGDALTGRRGAGCPECRGTGYRGRVGIYELLVVDDAIRAALVQGADAGMLRAIAVERGMRTLRDDGLRLVRAGRTTPDEVLRATRA